MLRQEGHLADVMIIIAMCGVPVMGEAAFAALKRHGQASPSHDKELYIV
jgi:NAD(P)H-flavin reductase